MINREFDYRMNLWHKLIQQGGSKHIQPKILHELGIYGGAQGIWVDKARTIDLTPDGTGITVGILHTGSSYPDDFSESGVLYHYPNTQRPISRDIGEIEATKAAGRFQLPIFVITRPSPNAKVRNVYLGWVEGWDDASELFLVSFQDEPPARVLTNPDEERPFSLLQRHNDRATEVPIRPNQQRFRFLVLQRYGAECAVCGLDVPELLEAVHIVPRSDGGADDPRNGLVLCANHHKALDAGLFFIDPSTLTIGYHREGPNKEQLQIAKHDISHLPRIPHIDALQWVWDNCISN